MSLATFSWIVSAALIVASDWFLLHCYRHVPSIWLIGLYAVVFIVVWVIVAELIGGLLLRWSPKSRIETGGTMLFQEKTSGEIIYRKTLLYDKQLAGKITIVDIFIRYIEMPLKIPVNLKGASWQSSPMSRQRSCFEVKDLKFEHDPDKVGRKPMDLICRYGNGYGARAWLKMLVEKILEQLAMEALENEKKSGYNIDYREIFKEKLSKALEAELYELCGSFSFLKITRFYP
jgi:hypothetical protein